MATQRRYRLLTHDGEALADLDQVTRVESLRVLNDIGWFSIDLPADYPTYYLDVDRLVEFWRQPDGGENQLWMVGFMRRWGWAETEDGTEVLRISGPDQIELLDRPTIGYASGEPEATKTDECDDMIKEIVRENKGALAGLTPEGRFRGYPAANFTVAPDLSNAPIITRSFHWRQMLPVLQEIAESSGDRGTPLYFDCVPAGPAQFEFRTYTGVRGIDHSVSAGIAPVVFSKEAGNLLAPELTEDWTEERNYVWGGGQGEGTSRLIDTENDLLRITRSIWNRREVFQDAREEATPLGVAGKAFERMEASRPKLLFSGNLTDSPRARFGVDWEFGDIVTARYRGKEFNGVIRLVRLTVDAQGTESLEARLEVEERTG